MEPVARNAFVQKITSGGCKAPGGHLVQSTRRTSDGFMGRAFARDTGQGSLDSVPWLELGPTQSNWVPKKSKLLKFLGKNCQLCFDPQKISWTFVSGPLSPIFYPFWPIFAPPPKAEIRWVGQRAEGWGFLYC